MARRQSALVKAKSAASAAPCHTKWSSVQPSACRSSGEIPCARILIGFSSRTHRAAGAARPVLPCWFAGLLERASSIRCPSLQIPVPAGRKQAAVRFLSPPDILRDLPLAGLPLDLRRRGG